MSINECIEILTIGIASGALFTIAPVFIGYGIEKAFNWLSKSTN